MDDTAFLYTSMGCCDVLAQNIDSITRFNIRFTSDIYETELKPQNFNLSKLSEKLSQKLEEGEEEALKIFDEITIYNSNFPRLSEKYKFPQNSLVPSRLFLNIAAYGYVFFKLIEWQKKILPAFEKEIIQLQNAAERFSYALRPLLKWDEELDFLFEGFPVHETLTQTRDKIAIIATLKDKFRATTLGRTVRLDDNTPFGNQGLDEFITVLWLFWHDTLGRTLEQKRDGINGRKQFLEFLMDCLKPIHPALEYETVDNALKKFQKKLKTGEDTTNPIMAISDQKF